MRSLRKAALHGTMWLTGGQYICSAVAIAGNLWLARLLGPEPFGAFFIVSSSVEAVFLLASFSFGQQLVQAPVLTRAHCRAAVAYASGMSAILVLLAACAQWAVGSRFTTSTLTLFLLLTIVRAVWNVALTFTALLERMMAYRGLVACRMAAALSGAGFALAVAVFGGGVWSLLAREAGMVVVGSLAIWIAVKRVVVFAPDCPNASPYREVWRFGCRLSGVQMLELAAHRLDGVLLGSLLGPGHGTELGYYAQAKYIASLPNLLADAGSRLVSYRVYAILRDDVAAVRRTVIATQFWVLRAIVPVALALFICAPALFGLTMGPRWTDGGAVLQAMCFSGCFLVLFNNLKMLRLTFEDWAGLYRAYVIQLCVLGIAMVAGVRLFGAVGGGVAYTLANLAGFVVIAAKLKAVPDFGVQMRNVCGPLAAATLAVAIVSANGGQSPERWVAPVTYALGVYGIVWGVMEWRQLSASLRDLRRSASA
jgi:O-antigen/teichoic acid export membrane protein